MPLPLPSHFRILLEALTKELRSLRTSIDHSSRRQIDAIRDAAETANETRKEIPARLSELRIPADVAAKEEAYREKSHRQQIWLTWGTYLAFTAAMIYAWIAYRQKQVMDDTLREMSRQTSYARDTAIAARDSANAAKSANDATRQMFRAKFIMWPTLRGDRGQLWITFKNVGKNTASDLNATGTLTLDSIFGGRPGKSQYKTKFMGVVQQDGAPDGVFAFDIPQVRSTTITPDSYLPPQWGDKIARINVTITFKDGFGEPSSQQFCRAIIADASVNANGQIYPEMPSCDDAPYFVNLRKRQIAQK
jgi:hypothetical protein